MFDDLTPPPRRPAPDELRRRIADELAEAHDRPGRRGLLLAPVAAALVLVAGVAALLGAGRADGQHDLVPVDGASTSSTAPTVAPTPSPSRRAAPQPETLARQPMTRAEVRRDTASCLKPDPEDTQPPPRSGTVRTRYAFVQPVVTPSADPPTQRVLFLQDDRGLYQCVDGVQLGWQALSAPGFEPTPTVPGGEVPNTGGGSSGSCGAVAGSTVDSEVLLQVDEERVAAVRVTLFSNHRAVRVADLPVDGPTLYVAVRLTGAAARLPMSFRVELRDDRGRVLSVQPYGPAGTKPAKNLTFELQSCADMEQRSAEHQPKPLTRPRSDQAGLASCRELVRTDGDQPLDLDRVRAEVTISTETAWGAVLSDGTHQLGCSLYPTREISAATRVTRNPASTEELFHWATNPITPDGESLWAAGHLPGATSIVYTLPDGTGAAATIDPQGYWMVMARTATAFDTEENTADWKPVRVTLTRNGTTRTYTIPWTVDTMCHQVSHGC